MSSDGLVNLDGLISGVLPELIIHCTISFVLVQICSYYRTEIFGREKRVELVSMLENLPKWLCQIGGS